MEETTGRLATLLAPPQPSTAQDEACRHLATALQSPLAPAQLGQQLKELLDAQQSGATRLGEELAASTEKTNRLVADTQERVARLRVKSRALKQNHERLEKGLDEAKSTLVSGLDAKDPEAQGLTLRERLVSLADRRAELVAAQKWFGAVAKAESLG